MKKIAKRIFVIICSVVVLLSCLVLVASADTYKSDGATYEIQTQGYYRYIIRPDANLSADKWMGTGAVIVGYTGLESSIVIPSTLGGETVVAIFNQAFKGNNAIQSVTIGETIKYVGFETFRECKGLQQVLIARSVEVISDHAFDLCSALKNVTFQNGSKLREIKEWAFASCTSLDNFIIPQGVETLGTGFLAYCDTLTSITVPNSVKSLGAAAFYHDDSLTEAVIGNGVPSLSNCKTYYEANWGIDRNINGTFEGCKSLKKITIGTGVKEIGIDCFAGTALTEVIIPDNVVSVYQGAFMNCPELQKVAVGNGVTAIGYQAFNNCDKLTDVSIGKSVVSIGDHAFFDCDGLKTITIPFNVTYLGNAAFFHCDSLETAVIGNGVTSLMSDDRYRPRDNWGIRDDRSGTFEGCKSLKKITIGTGVKEIGIDCFAGTALTEIIIPDNVVTVFAGAFMNCSELQKVVVGNGVTSIGDEAFNNCDKLTDVSIGKSVISIGNYAFFDCDGLRIITIPSNVTSLGKAAFYHCNSLETAVIGNGVTSLMSDYRYSPRDNWGADDRQAGTFEGCVSLTTVSLGSGIISIGTDTFAGTAITELTVPAKVSTISEGAFAGASKLERIYFMGNWAPNVGGRIFEGISAEYKVYYIDGKTGYDSLSYNMSTFTPITVKYDNNNPDVFAALLDNQIMSPSGGYVIEHISPVALRYIFGGWYKEPACTTKWDFMKDKATTNRVLYAKWIPVDTVAPVRPEKLQTVEKTGDQITLQWQAVDGAASYNIFVNGKQVNASAVTETKYAITGLEPATAYEFEVAAVNSIGQSEKSLVFVERTDDHIHEFGKWVVIKAADCKNVGEQERSCKCGSVEKETIPALGHTVVTTEAVAPTCTEPGYTAGKKCSLCNEIIEAQKEIPALGHTPSDWVVEKAATAYSEGLEVKKCAVCGARLEERAIPKLAIDFILGDVNGDGLVKANDARTALRAAAKLEELDEKALKAADIDGNGKVTAAEARKILRFAAKLDKELK